jgi:hypothetical protein
MNGRTARRREARRWVRRNRPAITDRLPSLVERYVFEPMEYYDGDLTHCPYFQGVGTCRSGCWSEPSCRNDEPLRGWPRSRMARGWWR